MSEITSFGDAASGQGVAFLNGTYSEALSLTREARDYIALQERADRQALGTAEQLVASCESMRLTTRLTQVMAWLLVQRAVQAGEMTREEARQPEHRLGAHEICEVEEPLMQAELPPRMQDLLQRSRALYSRVARLDAMLDA
jgi:regulator of CtrA degradation